jgi:hypothetical protein
LPRYIHNNNTSYGKVLDPFYTNSLSGDPSGVDDKSVGSPFEVGVRIFITPKYMVMTVMHQGNISEREKFDVKARVMTAVSTAMQSRENTTTVKTLV